MKFKYTISAKLQSDKRFQVYIAPSDGIVSDQKLLMDYTSGRRDQPHPRVYILPERWLSDDEYEYLKQMTQAMGLVKFEQILTWSKQVEGYGARSQSRQKLQLMWLIYCTQYFMNHSIESRRNLIPFHILIAECATTNQYGEYSMDYDKIIRLLTAHRNELDQWINNPALQTSIELLEAVAAGQHGANGCEDDRSSVYDDVSLAVDYVLSALHSTAWGTEEIPDDFWDTDIGRVIQHAQFWLECEELITITEAAMILRGSAEKRDLMSVAGFIERGVLRTINDPRENNPYRARRVYKSDVKNLQMPLD